MRIGMVGLGRMGGGMAARLRTAGHDVVGYDATAAARDVESLAGLVEALGELKRISAEVDHAASHEQRQGIG
jgi:3-hydroxyisobutyrate dehydrogenase-like beta-hydroxyacid dehydrogenase